MAFKGFTNDEARQVARALGHDENIVTDALREDMNTDMRWFMEVVLAVAFEMAGPDRDVSPRHIRAANRLIRSLRRAFRATRMRTVYRIIRSILRE